MYILHLALKTAKIARGLCFACDTKLVVMVTSLEILPSGLNKVLKLVDFLRKLKTKLSWFLFMAHNLCVRVGDQQHVLYFVHLCLYFYFVHWHIWFRFFAVRC